MTLAKAAKDGVSLVVIVVAGMVLGIFLGTIADPFVVGTPLHGPTKTSVSLWSVIGIALVLIGQEVLDR